MENEAFVGMGATLLDGVIVEKNAMVAAGALVRQNTKIPSGEVCEIFTFSFIWTFYNKLLVIDIKKLHSVYGICCNADLSSGICFPFSLFLFGAQNFTFSKV